MSTGRGLHMPLSGVALAQLGVCRTMVRMAKVRRLRGRGGYYMDYKDSTGRRRIRKGGDTEAEANFSLALEADKRLAARIIGPRNASVREQEQRPIAEQIAEYADWMEGRATSAKRIKETRRVLAAWSKAVKADTLADVDAIRTESWLAAISRSGRSRSTRNTYTSMVCGFTRWATDNHRMFRNELSGVRKLNENVDQRQPSRAMTVAEFDALIAAAPPDRQLWYMLAGRMGLRWSEVRRLRWDQFDLDGKWLALDAAGTKSQRADSLPVPDDLIAVLRDRMGIGWMFTETVTLRTWKKDLVRAGLVKLVDPSLPESTRYNRSNLGCYQTYGLIDRKSLRKTFGTHLAIAGVDLRITQRLMRHSDPKLTMKLYTDPMLLDMHGAANRASVALHELSEQNANIA